MGSAGSIAAFLEPAQAFGELFVRRDLYSEEFRTRGHCAAAMCRSSKTRARVDDGAKGELVAEIAVLDH
jgi:hypothetical protein